MSHQQRHLAVPACLALAVFCIVSLTACPDSEDNEAKTVTVITRNLYLGADVAPAIAALLSGDPEAIIGAVSEVWGHVQFTDFPARAESLAREIAAVQPDLVGLQEAALWRS